MILSFTINVINKDGKHHDLSRVIFFTKSFETMPRVGEYIFGTCFGDDNTKYLIEDYGVKKYDFDIIYGDQGKVIDVFYYCLIDEEMELLKIKSTTQTIVVPNIIVEFNNKY